MPRQVPLRGDYACRPLRSAAQSGYVMALGSTKPARGPGQAVTYLADHRTLELAGFDPARLKALMVIRSPSEKITELAALLQLVAASLTSQASAWSTPFLRTTNLQLLPAPGGVPSRM